MTSDLEQFNNFDKTFDKVNNDFQTYLTNAKQHIYFRNLEVMYSEAEIEKLLFTSHNFQWAPTTQGDLNIGNGPVFNMLFNTMNQYFNPNSIFNRDIMISFINCLYPTDPLIISSPYEVNVAENRGGTTYNYDFIISQI